jgi:hypothetical protein
LKAVKPILLKQIATGLSMHFCLFQQMRVLLPLWPQHLCFHFRDQKKTRNANPAISAVFPVFWLVYHAQFILLFVVTDPSKYRTAR